MTKLLAEAAQPSKHGSPLKQLQKLGDWLKATDNAAEASKPTTSQDRTSAQIPPAVFFFGKLVHRRIQDALQQEVIDVGTHACCTNPCMAECSQS